MSGLTPALKTPFLVGEFLVFPEHNELRRLDPHSGRPDSEPIRLTAKQMDVLVVLASKPGQPLGKSEIFEAVWPGVVVGEDNISSCIYELRKAFGEQANIKGESSYIKTVRQRGYLLAPAIVRPLPKEILAELEAPVSPTAEILLTPTPSAQVEEASSAEISPPILRAPTSAGPDSAAETFLLRRLTFWLGALALLVFGGFALVDRWGTFTVGIEPVENLSGDPSLDSLAELLERQYFASLGEPNGESYYRLRELRFFAGTLVRSEVRLLPDGRLELHAEVSGDRTGEKERLKAVGQRSSHEQLVKQLIESVRRELDSRACRMDTRVDLLKAHHCIDAGARLLKARSFEEADALLQKAATYYGQLLEGENPHEAAEGLLQTRDKLANLYDIEGQRQAALENIDHALALLDNEKLGLEAEDPNVLRIRRRAAQIAGDIVTEKGLLEKLRDLEPDNPDWRHALGWFLRTHERDCTYAELQFDEALDDDASDAALRATDYSYKGSIQLACGHPIEAIASFNRHIDASPDQADPFDMRADAYMTIGRYEEARDDLNKAQKLDPDLGSALLHKGNLEKELGHFQDAAREYRSYLESFGHWPNARRDTLIALGRLALLEGRFPEAENNARSALELQGGNRVQAYWLLGLTQLAAGNLLEAGKILAELEAMFAGTKSLFLREYLFHLRGELALAEGRGNEALQDLQEAIDNRPPDKIFFFAARAEALARLGRKKEALAAYRQLLDNVNRRHPHSLCAAAELAEELSSKTEAAELYARAAAVLGQKSDDPIGQACLERGHNFAAKSQRIEVER